MCGIIGITSNKPVATELYESLMNLQHRGQDSTGIATYNGRFHVVRGKGYVREAYTEESFKELILWREACLTKHWALGANPWRGSF